MVNEIVAIIGEYEPIILENGAWSPNYAQICGYVLICICVYSLFRIIGKAVFRK